MSKFQKIKSNELNNGFIFMLFFIVFFALAIILYFSPLVSDDLEFLSYNYRNFGEAFNYAFHYGNGRLLGNFLGIFLAPHPILSALYKSFTVACIGILIPYLLRVKSKLSYLISIILFLTVPDDMFSEVFAWNSGNANYASPIVFSLICLVLLFSDNKSPLSTLTKSVVIFIFGFAGQLFVEHNTAVNCIAAFCIMLYVLFKKVKGKRIISTCWFISSVLGTVFMLIIPKLCAGNMIKDMSSYRGFRFDSLTYLISGAAFNAARIGTHLASHAFLFLVSGLICYFILKKAVAKTKLLSQILSVLKICNFICPVMAVAFNIILKPSKLVESDSMIIYTLICLACAVEIVVFFVSVFLFINSKQEKVMNFILFVLLLFSVAPLLLTYSIGWRTSFFCMVVFISIAVNSFDKAMVNEIKDTGKKNLTAILSCAVCAILVCLFTAFVGIHDYTQKMYGYIESEMEKGAEQIDIFTVPSDYYLSNNLLGYKYYYKEFNDIEFNEIDCDQWMYLHSESLVDM